MMNLTEHPQDALTQVEKGYVGAGEGYHVRVKDKPPEPLAKHIRITEQTLEHRRDVFNVEQRPVDVKHADGRSAIFPDCRSSHAFIVHVPLPRCYSR